MGAMAEVVTAPAAQGLVVAAVPAPATRAAAAAAAAVAAAAAAMAASSVAGLAAARVGVATCHTRRTSSTSGSPKSTWPPMHRY